MHGAREGRADTHAHDDHTFHPEQSRSIPTARTCTSCKHPKAQEIDRKLRAGVSFVDVSRWLLTEHGTSLTSQSIASHAKAHVGIGGVRGRRPPSADFLESVRDAAADGLASGELAVTLKDGISAQKALDARESRDKDRDWQLKIAMLLSGHAALPPALGPEAVIVEGEFRPLLPSGAE